MNSELDELWKPNASKESGSYPGGDKLCTVRDTEASSEYIFSKVHPYIQHICKIQQSWNNTNNINSVQLFIKLMVRYLEQLDWFWLGHANRLKSWVGCKILSVCL